MRGALALLMGMAVALGGCFTTPEERAQNAAAIEARDDKACESAGLRPGTDQYAKCRLNQSRFGKPLFGWRSIFG
jgi:hypothetical protein